MTYNEALEYINSRLRFGVKPGLGRVSRLLKLLGDPHKRLRFVHIAGTNGKGSASTMIASALEASGRKTGLYTSPYICDFRERMQINRRMIPCEELAEITARVKALVESSPELDAEMTEFELITCIALEWFARQECDVVVLEVGLGGRLDATNVIEYPLCSVIMRIDLDHTSVLGDTVGQIAGEKAGIIKPGCPVVVFPDQPQEACEVIAARAQSLGCPLITPDRDAAQWGALTLDGTPVTYRGISYQLPLLGSHQILNSITAVEALLAIGIAPQHIAAGIERASIPARLELLSRSPLVILDGAHNPNGAAALADSIDSLLAGRRVVGVMGVLADKDYRCELEMLGARMAKIYTAGGYSPRALSADALCAIASQYTAAQACPSPGEAFLAALSELDAERDAIVICGSLYLAGALRGFVLEKMASQE